MEGQVAFVTGAGRGIGRAIALALAGAGARVALAARTAEDLAETQRQIREQGDEAVALIVDVSRAEEVERAVALVGKRFGPVDILVNNAGRQPPIGPLWENPADEWMQTVGVNLFGPLHCIQAVLPAMMRRRSGKIVNLSGGGATGPRPNFSAYASSKAALVRLTETLAAELVPYNVQVNAVAPGAINTRMLDEVIAAGERAGAEHDEALARARTGGTSLDLVCELVLFLASPASGRLTGKLISAVHDPWRGWAGRDEELNASPLYTLRRLDAHTVEPVVAELEGRERR